jgi:hypothetical protein
MAPRLSQRVLLPIVAGLTLISVASCGPQEQYGGASSPRQPSDIGVPGESAGGSTEGVRLSPIEDASSTDTGNRTVTENVTANSGLNDNSTLSGSRGAPRGSGDVAGSAGQPAPLGLAGSGSGSTPTIGLGSSPAVATPEVAGVSARQSTIEIAPENNSGVTGTATLSDLGNGRTRVLLTLTGSTGVHPAHIHDGVCASVNPAPKWPLNDVQNGTSSTELDAPLNEIASGSTAVNVHVSPQDETPVACGTIRPPA